MYVYLMGRGYSGSTILAILLGNSARIASVGGIISHTARLDALCSCGDTIRTCGFWRRVREEVTADGWCDWERVQAAGTSHGNVRNLPATAWARRDPEAAPERFRELAAITTRLESAIAKVSGRPVVLDSSKEPTRALFLLKYFPEARAIHIVRDPRGVLASYYWRLVVRKAPFYFLRRSYAVPQLAPLFLFVAAGSWLVGNLFFELIARVDRARVLRVRYEDLRDRPVAELRRIGDWLGLDLEDVVGKVERGEPLEIGHNVGGNHIREARQVRFDPAKERSRPQMPRWLEWMTIVVCGPLMRSYGYSLRRIGTKSAIGEPVAGDRAP